MKEWYLQNGEAETKIKYLQACGPNLGRIANYIHPIKTSPIYNPAEIQIIYTARFSEYKDSNK